MKRKSRPAPEGTYQKEAQDAARLGSQALALVRLFRRWATTTRSENHLRSLSIYPPSQSRQGMWLIIGKAWSGGYKLVAFHRGTDPLTAILGFMQRLAEDKLDWKADEFAEGKPHP